MRLLKEDSIALQIDIQGKLATLMFNTNPLIEQTKNLINGLQALEIEILINEQVPDKLGPTVPALKALLPEHPIFPKHTFSVWDEPKTREFIEKTGKKTAILYGIETHVCVNQTTLDMLEAGYQVVLVADALGSRFVVDHEIALRRLQSAGAIVTTMESLLFELCRDSKAAEFKAVSRVATSRFF